MLSDYRTVLVEDDIRQTVRYHLAGEPRLVDVVLQAHGRSERVSVASVRELVDAALGRSHAGNGAKR